MYLILSYLILSYLIYEGDSYVRLAFSVFFDYLLKDEYRIRGASSWHKSKLGFMNFHALSQPSVNHLLPYFEGECKQFDATVILTLLNVTLFFENGDQNAVSPGRWYALSGHDYVEKFAKCHHSQLSQAFPYLHWYLVAAHSLATLHPSQCSLSVSASLTGLVMPWLGALSSVSTRGLSSFIIMSQLKYWPHRSLIYSSFISTSPVALLMVLICPMSFPALATAIL